MKPSPAEVTKRLKQVSERTCLDAETRLEAKLDMSPAAVARRLREASALLALCSRLHATARR